MSDVKDSITQVAEESFVRERPLEIERGAVLAGRYQVEEVIGKGGSGVVLRVFDRTVQDVVALKVLKSELARDAKWDKRFSRELRLGRPIQHANVCRIFDIGEADGHRFLTMELATGGSLRDELKIRPALERPLAERLADARAAIEGLAAIHAAGVVHRDFKPDNLLRMADGRLVISDFGLATDAAAVPGVTVMIGTPHYMAPEVLGGEPATARSDVWALGVVLHEILFGRRPERRSVSFDGSESRPVRPTSPTERALLGICERCLADDPRRRPPDGGAVRGLVDEVQARSRRSLMRKSWAVLGGMAAVAALIGGTLALRLQLQGGRASPSATGDTAASSKREPAGMGANWATAPVIAEVSGRVHCFSMLDGNTARLIWGQPRHAEDLELRSGRRRPSSLAAYTYMDGCPDLNPHRGPQSLLFTALGDSGTSEVWFSEHADGSAAKMVVSGRNPVWLGDDEFVFDVDMSHAAIFSLDTMTSALISNGSLGDQYGIRDKVATRDARSVALLFTDLTHEVINVVTGHDGKLQRTWMTPGAIRIGFAGERLLVSYQRSTAASTLARLDVQTGDYVNVGGYPGFDTVNAAEADEGDVVLVRRIAKDAWGLRSGRASRLTNDGQTGSVSLRENGDLLLGRRDDLGNWDIWLRDATGERRLTSTHDAATPAFAPDGQRWAYADYRQKAVLVCEDRSGTRCARVYRDESLPTQPTFSPDGRWLAVATELRTPRVVTVAIANGAVRGSWDAARVCGPVWSADQTVWSIEKVATGLTWSERTPEGRRTGRHVALTEADAVGDGRCWPEGVGRVPGLGTAWIGTTELSRLIAVPGP
ncbi:MAG TPA: protein kinase [Polyangia bacterium]|nr:protein kinase [Polyangia bacterium]